MQRASRSASSVCFARSSRRAEPLLRLLERRQDLVDEAVVLRLGRGHEVIAVGILRDHLDGLTGVLRVELVDRIARAQDLLRADLDVLRLALKPGERLMD